MLLAATLALAIDTAHSTAGFSVAHVYVERVSGTVPIAGGTVTLQPNSSLPVAVSATLDAVKIRTGDDDRDDALRGPDWFDTKRFPVWTFVSTGIRPSGPSSFELDGTLTVHGVAQPERLNVTIAGTPQHPEYRAAGTIDRHAFGMAITRLDPAIGNSVDITLDVTLK